MGFLPCPCTKVPCHSKHDQESDISPNTHSRRYSSDSSSLSSQPSLPSLPSLTFPQPTTTADHRCISTLKGHHSSIFSLTLVGKHLYSGYSDGQILLWPRNPSSENLSIGNTIASGESAVKSMVVCGSNLFSGHQDCKIRVWKLDSENPYPKLKCVSTLPTLNDRITKLFLSKNYVEVRRHKQCTWVHHVDAVSALAVSKDGSLIYSGSWDRTFKVWRTSDYKCVESVWKAHDDAINAIAVSHDGFIYTGSADRKIKVWKRSEKKHELVDTLENHKSAVNALALSTDGSVLYSGACDRSIIVWEKAENCQNDGGDGGGEKRRHMVVAGALRGHSKAILCIGVVGSDLVCSGSADKTVRIWRRGIIGNRYSCVAVLEGHNGPVKCLAAAVESTSADASGTSLMIYTGSLDYNIKVWRVWAPFI